MLFKIHFIKIFYLYLVKELYFQILKKKKKNLFNEVKKK